MPYYEICTDMVIRLFVKADNMADAIQKVLEIDDIEEENIRSIERHAYNMVIV